MPNWRNGEPTHHRKNSRIHTRCLHKHNYGKEKRRYNPEMKIAPCVVHHRPAAHFRYSSPVVTHTRLISSPYFRSILGPAPMSVLSSSRRLEHGMTSRPGYTSASVPKKPTSALHGVLSPRRQCILTGGINISATRVPLSCDGQGSSPCERVLGPQSKSIDLDPSSASFCHAH